MSRFDTMPLFPDDLAEVVVKPACLDGNCTNAPAAASAAAGASCDLAEAAPEPACSDENCIMTAATSVAATSHHSLEWLKARLDQAAADLALAQQGVKNCPEAKLLQTKQFQAETVIKVALSNIDKATKSLHSCEPYKTLLAVQAEHLRREDELNAASAFEAAILPPPATPPPATPLPYYTRHEVENCYQQFCIDLGDTLAIPDSPTHENVAKWADGVVNEPTLFDAYIKRLGPYQPINFLNVWLVNPLFGPTKPYADGGLKQIWMALYAAKLKKEATTAAIDAEILRPHQITSIGSGSLKDDADGYRPEDMRCV